MSTDNSQAVSYPALLEQGRRYLKEGEHRAARAVADRLLQDFEPTPASMLFAGEVQFFIGNFRGAGKIAADCAERFPDDPTGQILQCRALMALGRQGDARDLALGLAKSDIEDDSQIEILVTVLSGCLVPEAAYPLCKKAVEQDPYNVDAHRRLALNCRLVGRIDEAIEATNIALRFNAHDYEMISLRSTLQTASPDNNHIAELEALLAAGCKNALGGAQVAYALAKECEEIGDFERSFGFLEAGARFKRQTFRNLRLDEDVQTIDLLTEAYTPARMADAAAGYDSNEPIFILGLPRTGSTLLERIVSSHSQVQSAGELYHFDAAMVAEVQKLGPIRDRADLIDKSLGLDMSAVGRAYIERTRAITGQAPHFVDKRPLNFVSLGMIALALPNAAIVHVRRTPMDTCYAIFKFLFNEAYPWSYDLEDLARYYIAYRKLMDHWRAVLPDRIIEVTYENLVENLETEARKVIASLNLGWEPGCLEFHDNEAATLTGSAVQVRQRIYASSVGRWKNYEKQLAPLASTLEAAGIDPYSP